MKTFESSLEMQRWINANIYDQLKREQLYRMGCDHKKQMGTYAIQADMPAGACAAYDIED